MGLQYGETLIYLNRNEMRCLIIHLSSDGTGFMLYNAVQVTFLEKELIRSIVTQSILIKAVIILFPQHIYMPPPTRKPSVFRHVSSAFHCGLLEALLSDTIIFSWK